MLFPPIFPDAGVHLLCYLICRAPWRLSHLLSCFPNLHDVEIRQFFTSNILIPDTQLALPSTPKLRGQLTPHDFLPTEAWTHRISASGGLKFRSMVLHKVVACAPILLGTCAKTLETLRFYVADDSG
jgi:hypothetical protein